MESDIHAGAPLAPAPVVDPVAAPAPTLKRRYAGPPVAEVAAGGDWLETFWIRTTLTFEDVAEMERQRRRLNLEADGPDLMADVSIVLFLAGRMLERWTLEHAPASAEAFSKLPAEMVQPVIEAVGNFLRSRSTQPKLTPMTSSNLTPSITDSSAPS